MFSHRFGFVDRLLSVRLIMIEKFRPGSQVRLTIGSRNMTVIHYEISSFETSFVMCQWIEKACIKEGRFEEDMLNEVE